MANFRGPSHRLIGFVVFVCALAFFGLIFAPLFLIEPSGGGTPPVNCECIEGITHETGD